MAGQAGGTPITYSPSPTTRKTKSLIFRNDDVDWVRTDGREFHQCRPACKPFSVLFKVASFILVFIFVDDSHCSILLLWFVLIYGIYNSFACRIWTNSIGFSSTSSGIFQF